MNPNKLRNGWFSVRKDFHRFANTHPDAKVRELAEAFADTIEEALISIRGTDLSRARDDWTRTRSLLDSLNDSVRRAHRSPEIDLRGQRDEAELLT